MKEKSNCDSDTKSKLIQILCESCTFKWTGLTTNCRCPWCKEDGPHVKTADVSYKGGETIREYVPTGNTFSIPDSFPSFSPSKEKRKKDSIASAPILDK